jgi:hypothetical protein
MTNEMNLGSMPHRNSKNQCCGLADPGCLSRILIFTHPGSLISDPKTATKERGEKKFDVIPFYATSNFSKLKIVLILKW